MDDHKYIKALVERFGILPASAQAILNSSFDVQVIVNDAFIDGYGHPCAVVRNDVYIMLQSTRGGPTHTRHPREHNVTNHVINLVRKMEASKCKN